MRRADLVSVSVFEPVALKVGVGVAGDRLWVRVECVPPVKVADCDGLKDCERESVGGEGELEGVGLVVGVGGVSLRVPVGVLVHLCEPVPVKDGV